MRVTLVMRGGPMAGGQKELDLGAMMSDKLIIGREPGPGGFILEGDVTVSRRHGELLQEDGGLAFANLSANGSEVDGTLLMGRRVLPPGSVLKLGSHELEVRYQPPPSQRPSSASAGAGSPWSEGLLAKPVVRILLVGYFLGILGLALYLSAQDGDTVTLAYQQARDEYLSQYLPSQTLPAALSKERLGKADQLVLELKAHIRSQRWELAKDICHELMALDQDTRSPMYRFAARRLGDLAGRR